MSTRFSQWRNTEYVGLPVESYLQAGLIKDQKIDTELQKTSAALAEYKSLQALGANAEAYQNEIMSGIRTQLEDLAKGNLKSPEALMKMQSIVTNPDYVNGLKQIAKHTEYFRAAQKAAQEYEKESGNKINAAPFYKAYQELMNETGDATKFNPSRFAGLESVPKYMEVQKEINDFVSKMKPNTRVWNYQKGNYDVIQSREELTADRILNAVRHEFGSRQDIMTQLQRNIDYNAFASGMDVESKGENIRTVYNKNFESIVSDIDTYKTDPVAFKKKYNISSNDEVASTLASLEAQKKQYDQMRKLDSRSLLVEESINTSAMSAISGFAYFSDKMKKTQDSFKLAKYQSDLRQQQIDELDKLAKGNTAIVDMGLVFGQDAAVQDNKVKDGSYLRELAGAINMDVKKFNIAGGPVRKYKGAVADVAGGQGWIDLFRSNSPEDQQKKQELVTQLAEKYGYRKGVSDEPNAEAFLQNVYRKNNHMGKGVYNNNFDSEAITKGISTGSGAVYVNGVLVSDDSKNDYLNMLNNPTNEARGVNLAKSAKPIISVRMDGVVVANYRNPAKPNETISYEIPGGLSYGFDKLREISVAKATPTYGIGINKPVDVVVPGIQTTRGEIPGTGVQFTAARVGDGTNNLVMFRDAANPKLQILGATAIQKVAKAMAGSDFDKYLDADKIKFYNKAIEAINNNYRSNIVKGPDGKNSIAKSSTSGVIQITRKDGTKEYVNIEHPIFVINQGIKSNDELVQLRIGMGDNDYKVQTGKGFVNLGGSFSEDIVFQELYKKAGEMMTSDKAYRPQKAARILGDEYLPINVPAEDEE